MIGRVEREGDKQEFWPRARNHGGSEKNESEEEKKHVCSKIQGRIK